jgi:hypothetical protein
MAAPVCIFTRLAPRYSGRAFGVSPVKDYLTNFALWLAAACSLLLLLYFLTSPFIFLNTNKGASASPFLLKLSGPVVYVLESDFKKPMLWYFGLWGIEIEYFAREPVPEPPWYTSPAYLMVSVLCLAALGAPLWRWRRKKLRISCRTSGSSQ